MDSYEATKVVFTRIQALDPENASKIMGFIFIQDPCEKEMIRLAYGPENILISLINQAKTHLGIAPISTLHVAAPGGFHRRSYSVDDACEEGEGFGWRPCVYYAKGFCKNGGNCKFLHGGGPFSEFSPSLGSPGNNMDGGKCKFLHGGGQFGEFSPSLGSPGSNIDGGKCRFLNGGGKFGEFSENGGLFVGSPGSSGSGNVDGFDELLRIKAIQQQQRINHLMGFNKGIGFINNNDSPTSRSAAAALMMDEELHKFGRCRSERSDFSAMGLGGADSTARQIYLTFPAESTFKEDDVSNYFSKFGPVQDVRIPYQQKRMFGFVTFLYPGTVKAILAKGNPHFVCDSRVLVKPYKEKGKIPEKRQHQFGGGDFAACLSPTGSESLDSYDFPIGPRMLVNNQEMLRRKLEQAEYQQAIELQGRRLMNLQLMDLKNHQHHHRQHAHQFHPSISSPVFSPLQSSPSFLLRAENNSNLEILEDTSDSLVVEEQHDELDEVNGFLVNNNADANGNSEDFFNLNYEDLQESLEHTLPDNFFASPTKSAAENGSVFFSDAHNSSSVVASPSSPSSNITSSSLESRYFHIPRFSPGQEAVDM